MAILLGQMMLYWSKSISNHVQLLHILLTAFKITHTNNVLEHEQTSRIQCLYFAKWLVSGALRPIIHFELMQQHDYVSLEWMNKLSGSYWTYKFKGG